MCSLINIFLIALMVQSGLAIHCFTCDSSTNQKCTDLSDKTIKAEECTYKQLGDFGNKNEESYHQKSWLMRLSEVNYFKISNEFDIPMVCQKLVGIDEEKRTTTLRRCQLKNIGPCNLTQQAKQFNREIVHCSVCETDSCNGSSSNNVFGMLIGAVTAIIISIHFIL